MSVLLVAELHGRAGLEMQLGSFAKGLAEASVGEPECIDFRVLAAEEPAELVLLASWSGEAAMRAHYDTSHYRYYRDQVEPLLARPSDVIVHHVSATVHALDPNPPDPGLLG